MTATITPARKRELMHRTWWLTRDPGMTAIDVWTERPDIVGGIWITDGFPRGHWGQLTVEQVRGWLGKNATLPDTERECVRIG